MVSPGPGKARRGGVSSGTPITGKQYNFVLRDRSVARRPARPGMAGQGKAGEGGASGTPNKFTGAKDEAGKDQRVGSRLFGVPESIPGGQAHLGELRGALKAGVSLPPIIVEKKSLRVVDGFHRAKVYEGLYGKNHLVDILEKKYVGDAHLFRDAIRHNSSHGLRLSPWTTRTA